MIRALIFCIAFAGSLSVAAETNTNSIGRLMRDLGSDDWKVREQSQAALIELGEHAADPILAEGIKQLRNPSDPELTYRITSIVRSIVLTRFFHTQRGFLGVGLRNTGLVMEYMRKDVYPVEVSYIVPNTAAQQNGVQMGFQILKVDDHVCTLDFQTPQMIEHISSRKPGESVRFEFFAGGRIIKKDIELGVRPAMPTDPSIASQKEEYFNQWLADKLKKKRAPETKK